MRSSFVWIIPVMRLQLARQGELPELALTISQNQLPFKIYSINTIVKNVYSSSTHTLTSYFVWFSLIKSPITTIWSDEYSKLQCMVWTKFWLLYHPEPPTQGEVIKTFFTPSQKEIVNKYRIFYVFPNGSYKKTFYAFPKGRRKTMDCLRLGWP